ncbi:hypothetical protein DAPPUDRAFT_268277 [Daphnia pulex]|uniref:Uncharacterized protein n=1 Tax=Daphnia pulex TaxID=6669 RepID=E9HXK1_DAPPU|nr:hypothetical protein DAPPUDRAFT_268277 [Daphnia pulex]|eukprot:EFX63529.1 hypothetical protein DAPPUDRAFT_268277 [Daphnia pulex]
MDPPVRLYHLEEALDNGQPNGKAVAQASASKRSVVEDVNTEPDLTDVQYKIKVIKLFEEVVAVMKKKDREQQSADLTVENLPLQHYNEIEDLNSALANNDLSIAMCAFFKY